MNKTTFGMTKVDYDALMDAINRKGYEPSQERIERLMAIFPNASREQAVVAMKLINSPARNSFTTHDVFSHLEELNKKKK